MLEWCQSASRKKTVILSCQTESALGHIKQRQTKKSYLKKKIKSQNIGEMEKLLCLTWLHYLSRVLLFKKPSFAFTNLVWKWKSVKVSNKQRSKKKCIFTDTYPYALKLRLYLKNRYRQKAFFFFALCASVQYFLYLCTSSMTVCTSCCMHIKYINIYFFLISWHFFMRNFWCLINLEACGLCNR